MIIIVCKCVFDVLWINSYFGKNMVIFVSNNVLVKSVNNIYGGYNVFRFGLFVLFLFVIVMLKMIMWCLFGLILVVFMYV